MWQDHVVINYYRSCHILFWVIVLTVIIYNKLLLVLALLVIRFTNFLSLSCVFIILCQMKSFVTFLSIAHNYFSSMSYEIIYLL